MSPVPVICQPFEQKLLVLQGQLEAAKTDHAAAETAEDKMEALAQIHIIAANIVEVQIRLRKCILDNTPPPPPLAAVFYGTATLRIDHPRTPDPLTTQVSIPLNFSSSHARFTLGALPVFSKAFSTPLGQNITTMTLTPGRIAPQFVPRDPPSVVPIDVPIEWYQQAEYWTFVHPRGWMEIYLFLTFSQSIDLGDWFDTQQRNPEFVRLSTEITSSPSRPESFSSWVQSPFAAAGASMNESGLVTLIAAGQLRCEGVLGGRNYLIQVSGLVTPSPLLAP
jgi:hypothetical protein